MNTMFRSAIMAAAIAALPVTAAFAQTNTPAGAGSGTVASPTYPTSKAGNPALTGHPNATTSATPSAHNPTVAGATGHTVVPGNNSTISGDHGATVREKTGGKTSSGG